MNTNTEIILTTLIGDALSLGAHWIYSQREIAEKLSPVKGYSDPLSSYHPGKTAGAQTHYGDQTLILLESIQAQRGFNLDDFAARWRAFWEDAGNRAYRDGATRTTLVNLQSGTSPANAGSDSNDIAGAARIAPLLLAPFTGIDDLVAAARSQTAFTHRDGAVIEAAEFFARLAWQVRAGQPITEALNELENAHQWDYLEKAWFVAARLSAASEQPDNAAAKAHGLTCHTPDAFPLVLHLLRRYPVNATKALVANVEAGGDSAARGLLLGLVYGARPHSISSLKAWRSGLQAAAKVIEAVEGEVCRG